MHGNEVTPFPLDDGMIRPNEGCRVCLLIEWTSIDVWMKLMMWKNRKWFQIDWTLASLVKVVWPYNALDII
ncbi:hypothetical protein ANTQUA_LOCUS2647 [Anthophora quadrimaculata]